MPSSPTPLRNLHIFLAKEGYRDPSVLLSERDSYHFEPVRTRAGYMGLLFVKPSSPRPPDWLKFFDGALDSTSTLPLLLTASASAVLIMEVAGRCFLLTFGYGRSMIADGVVESRFGLKATLNTIHQDKLRSLDRRSFERIQRQTREQLSRDAGFHAFGLNVEQDLLCAVVGTPDIEIYGNRLAGRDALSAYVPCNLEDVPILLEWYLELSQSDRYKTLFPWVDNIADVTDRRTRERLDLELCHKIRRYDLADIVLTPPDLINWDEFGYFAYRSNSTATQYTELTWEDYFRDVRGPIDVTPERLRSDRILCARGDGSGILETWGLHRCIAGELLLDEDRYVLSEGKWYRIDQDFAARVVTSVQNMACCEEALPPYAHIDEESYNRAAADSSTGRWALMDRRLIRTGTAHGSIEFCDLYSDQKRMIHVKRYAGSSPLSHLFAQGVVAAKLYQGEPAFRRLVNAELPASHQLSNPDLMIDPREYEVAYAIIGASGRPPSMPFFSMVNLRGAVEILAGMNYKVTLTHV